MLSEKLRYVWHEIYYRLGPRSGQRFALTCREVVSQVDATDVREASRPRLIAFRVSLHLSLCQACNNYEAATRALGDAIRKAVSLSAPIDLNKVNQDLLAKHAAHSAKTGSPK
jgi:hypothetical protein